MDISTIKINILAEMGTNLTTKVIAIISSVVFLILLLSYLVLSLLQSKAGPIIGIICSILYIINLNIFNLVLGIGFLISCISMIKELNKM